MRRAFTLVELLAATALSAVLMLAVLQVIGSIGRSRPARGDTDLSQRDDLVELLRRDLSQSTSIRFGSNEVTLTGHSAIEPGTRALSHQPVTVTYVVMTIGGRSWLVRRQIARNGRSMDAPYIELVAPDVSRLEIQPTGMTVVALAPSGEGQPIPPTVVIRLTGSDGKTWERELILR